MDGEDQQPPDGAGRPDQWLPPTGPSEPPAGSGYQQPTYQRPTQQAPGAVGRPPLPSPRPTTRRASWVRAARVIWAGLGVTALLLLIVANVAGVVNQRRNHTGTPPHGSPASSPAVPELHTKINWKTQPGQLRSDLDSPEFVISVDGDFNGTYVAAVNGIWLTITGTEDATDTMLHGLAPDTGKVIWQRRLDGVLCASEAPKSAILCASVLERDRSTGLGIRWRLHVIDPADGSDRRTADIDGWLTAVHRSGNSFVLLEQRQPAPHAVVRAFDVDDLTAQWTRDLRDQPGQADMFSKNRITGRPEPERKGLALDRPRFRDVGSGLVAIWAGQTTAFIDVGSGKLIMMPHCSRLVDDGKRLWCNETDGASSYSYRGKRMHRIHGPRLAFPDDDGVGVDRNRPIFIDDTGAPISVNLKTGRVRGPYGGPGAGSAFGLKTMPGAETVGPYTFLVGEAGTMLIDPTKDRLLWTNPHVTQTNLPILRGDKVLVGDYYLAELDPATGKQSATIAPVTGSGTVAIGDRMVGLGSDEIADLTIG